VGRKPTKPNAIPRLRLRRSGNLTRYYYDHGIVKGKRWREPLGTDYAAAIKRWAELEGEQAGPIGRLTFEAVAKVYQRDVIPTKAERTQRDNGYELGNLLAFFNDPPALLDAIEPLHVKQYMRWRKKAPIRATREKALLSHIWNWARGEGYTAKPNPCAGIEGTTAGRAVYVEDAEYLAIMDKADEVLRDAMELAYLTGQRPADVLKMTVADVRDGAIHVRQNKTGAFEEIEVTGELAALIERIKRRKAPHKIYSTRLIVNEAGRPFGVNALSRRFRKAADAAGFPRLQFRDLRAKAATDKLTRSGDITQSQRLLGHSSTRMTEAYIRQRKGHRITPTR
jgi:integrase